jgi:hypothetical protein
MNRARKVMMRKGRRKKRTILPARVSVNVSAGAGGELVVSLT